MGLYSVFSQAFAFYEPEFMAITEEQLEAFKAEEPALVQYSHQFEKLLATKDHVLSQEVEEVLATTSEIFESPAETFSVLDNASLRFPEIADEDGHLVPLSHGNYIHFMESKTVTSAKKHMRLCTVPTNSSSIPMLRLCSLMSRSIT